MKAYNIDIFTDKLAFKSHGTVDEFKYSYDYLDPENNKIKILAPLDVDTHDYIRVTGGGLTVWGSITKTERGTSTSKDFINITFRDIEDMLDVDLVIDTDLLGRGSLEEYIAARIADVYINNPDMEQNIQGLTVAAAPATYDWILDIDIEKDDHYTVVNLLDDIILPAFKRDMVRVLFEYNITDKAITATVSVHDDNIVQIETGLPNVISKSIKYKTIKKESNKTSIYNKKRYATNATYYLHTDGSFNETDADRLTPVYFKVETVDAKTTEEYMESYLNDLSSAISTVSSVQSTLEREEEPDEEALEKQAEAIVLLNKVPGISLSADSTGLVAGWDADATQEIVDAYAETPEYETVCAGMAQDEFDEKAYEAAAKTFGANKYENLIEIECMNDDELISSGDMEVGQIVHVIDDGKVYETILTGKKIEKTTKLIFGNVRLELTKYLKGRS